MSVANFTVFGEIVAGSRIIVAEYPSKPGGCGIWYKLPNGNKQTAFPKAELEASESGFFKSQNLDIEIQVNDGAEFERLIWTEEDFTTLSLPVAVMSLLSLSSLSSLFSNNIFSICTSTCFRQAFVQETRDFKNTGTQALPKFVSSRRNLVGP